MNADEHEISVSIGPEMAELMRGLSPEDQAKMQVILGALVGEMSKMNVPALGKVMDTISHNAQAQGLTPTILEELLGSEQATQND